MLRRNDPYNRFEPEDEGYVEKVANRHIIIYDIKAHQYFIGGRSIIDIVPA